MDDKIVKNKPAKILAIECFALNPDITTKEVAALYIVPKVATQENIDAATGEAKELYGLFKDWAKGLASPEIVPEEKK